VCGVCIVYCVCVDVLSPRSLVFQRACVGVRVRERMCGVCIVNCIEVRERESVCVVCVLCIGLREKLEKLACVCVCERERECMCRVCIVYCIKRERMCCVSIM